MAREATIEPGSIGDRHLARKWGEKDGEAATIAYVLARQEDQAEAAVADAGLGYATAGAVAINTPGGGGWLQLQWNQPAAGDGNDQEKLLNGVMQWPSTGAPWQEIRPYVAGVHRVSVLVNGGTDQGIQVWVQTELEVGVFLNGNLWRYANTFIPVAAGVPGPVSVSVFLTCLVPIWDPQNPADPATAGDIVTFGIRTTSGTAQYLLTPDISVEVNFEGPETWTDYSP